MMKTRKVTQNDYDLADLMLSEMPKEKKEVLKKALDRNDFLTSTRGLEFVYLYSTKHGFVIKMEGTRASFSLFMDNEMNYRRMPKGELKTDDFTIYEVRLNKLGYENELDKYTK